MRPDMRSRVSALSPISIVFGHDIHNMSPFPSNNEGFCSNYNFPKLMACHSDKSPLAGTLYYTKSLAGL